MRLEVRRALYSARELVEVAIVEVCLEALHVALRLDHPTLGDHAALGDPPTLRRARCVDRRARELQTPFELTAAQSRPRPTSTSTTCPSE